MDHHQRDLSTIEVFRIKKLRILISFLSWILMITLQTSHSAESGSTHLQPSHLEGSTLKTPDFQKATLEQTPSKNQIYTPQKSDPIQFRASAALNVPQPLQVGIEVFRSPDLIPFFDVGYFQFPPFGGGSKSFSAFNFQTGVKYNLFKARWIYTSLSMGVRKISFSGDTSAFKIEDEVVATTGSIRITSFFVAPKIGFRVGVSQRVHFEFDLGIQFPLYYSGDVFLIDETTGANSSNSPTLKVSSSRSLSRIAGMIIPEITLFRIIWSF